MATTNAAEALRRAHTALIEDLRKLQNAIHPSAAGAITDLRTRLVATRQHIIEHFRWEEHDGYMDKFRKREPRLEHAIHNLLKEHRELAKSLDSIIATLATASEVTPTVREDVLAWVQRLREHEIHEDELVQEAFNRDIGPED